MPFWKVPNLATERKKRSVYSRSIQEELAFKGHQNTSDSPTLHPQFLALLTAVTSTP